MRNETMKLERPSIGMRVAALISAGMMAAACISVPTALATDVTPSAGEQTGTGATLVTVQLRHGSDELGGTDDSNNPDVDGDGYGDNIAFSVPTTINFVANSKGTLSGPTNAQIQNHSKFAIHTSAFQVNAESDWNIVADASTETRPNAIDFQIGPQSDMLDASAHLTKANVVDPTAWNMAASNGALTLRTTGDINNVRTDITSATRVATIQWYVTPGIAS